MEQLSQEWFAARSGRVTGSIAGALLGLSPFMTKFDAMRKLLQTAETAIDESNKSENPALLYGKGNEENALHFFELETELTVTKTGFHTYQDWLGASPDGVILEEKAVVEIKCPYGIRNDELPVFKPIKDQPQYYLQTQLEMLCTDAIKCYFYQWTPHGTALEIVERDNQYIDEILPQLFSIWESVHNQKQELIDAMEEYISIDQDIKRLTELRTIKLAQLVDLAGNQDTIVGDFKLQKIERSGSVSYAKAIKELLPDADLSKWVGKPTTYWRVA